LASIRAFCSGESGISAVFLRYTYSYNPSGSGEVLPTRKRHSCSSLPFRPLWRAGGLLAKPETDLLGPAPPPPSPRGC
jgi:hypothetical protein